MTISFQEKLRFEGNPHTIGEWGRWLADRFQAFLRTPEAPLMDAGASGEVFVARIRVLLTSLVFLVPAVDFLLRPHVREVYVGLAYAGTALGLALLAYRLVRRRLYRPWIGLASGLLDVSLVSLALLSFLSIGQPYTTLNSRVVYPIYMLAIAASALRFDPRICALTGVAAMGQYLLVVAFTVSTRVLLPGAPDAVAYGRFDWSDQISRLLLLGIAGVISTAIVIRTRRLQWLSARDRLTQVINRSVFEDLMQDETVRAQRAGQPLGILVVDIDRFRAFNDVYGHAVGDASLRLLAATIRQLVGRAGLVARYGGDEFAILLPGATPDRASALAETIRQGVAASPPHPTRASMPQPLTVSIGVATLPQDAAAARELCLRAEWRLRWAQGAGGDRVADAMVAAEPHGGA